MRLHLTKKDCGLVLSILVFLAAIALAGAQIGGQAAVLAVAVVSPALVVVVGLEVYRRITAEYRASSAEHLRERQLDYRQLESLLSLLFALQPERPLPDTRGWAASPDLLKKIADTIFEEKPVLVVEAGSGVSSLVIALCLKKLGRGRVVSLEHEPGFAEANRHLLAIHGLADVATVAHTPLTTHSIGGRDWLWYETGALEGAASIDLLVVDGPPGVLQPQSRYPALPLLYGRLGKRAVIILDDGRRVDEQAVAARWQTEFALASVEFLDTEKGAFLMRKGA